MLFLFNRKATVVILSCCVFFLLAAFVASVIGLRINKSKSIPLGFYWVTEKPIAIGEYVLLCPPESLVFDEARKRGYLGSGLCPGGYEYLMKKVLAAQSDRVVINEDGVFVNNKKLPFSKPLRFDGSHRPLPIIRTESILGNSELLLMTDVSSTSFDSRYFGFINRSQIKSVIQPIYTW